MIDVCCYALLTRLIRVKQSFLYMYPLWFLCEYGFHPPGNSGMKSSSNFEHSRKQVTVLVECISILLNVSVYIAKCYLSDCVCFLFCMYTILGSKFRCI